MKNKKVKVVLITILIIVLILSCVIIITMNMHNETFKATIIKKHESINGNPMILVERIYYNNGELAHGDYFDILILEKTSITYKGKKIDISELEEGDTVSITYADEYLYTVSPTPIKDTKKIKLLEKHKSINKKPPIKRWLSLCIKCKIIIIIFNSRCIFKSDFKCIKIF